MSITREHPVYRQFLHYDKRGEIGKRNIWLILILFSQQPRSFKFRFIYLLKNL